MAKRRILCVEDHLDTCELLTVLFRQLNCETISATSFTAALAHIEKSGFDLYVLDQKLPDGAGTELCRLIRECDKQAPIIFFSAMARNVDRQAGLEAGAQEYLIKPADFTKLATAAKRLLPV